jgi:hypothetical protein
MSKRLYRYHAPASQAACSLRYIFSLTWYMRTPILVLITTLLFVTSCRKSSEDKEKVEFYGQDLVVVKQRLGGEWKNHYVRNATGQIVTFPDCFLNFKFNSADSLIITCNA